MFQASAFNGQGEITYNWDFDNDGEYDEEGEVACWSWNLPGAYWIKLKATDEIGESDYYDTLVAIQFGASKPAKPSGQTNIKAGLEYTYTTTVNTQSGYWNHVYYKFSWGDGTETDWIETPSASHSWNKKSRYEVKVKALLTHESTRDQDDAEDFKETDWSDPLAVSLPRSRSTTRSFIQLLQYFFENYPNAFPLLRQLLGL